VESVPGEGTTMRVLLPVAGDEEEHTERGGSSEDSKTAGAVLLVDDDPVALGATRLILEQLGFEVLTATNGREALAIHDARKGGLAFVLLDLTMPEMDGEETFNELLLRDPDVRVIIASGYDRYDVAHRFAENSPKAFIQKPYKVKDLQAILSDVLERE
jgi:DNA-binding NtrC family response regulator